MQNDKIQDQLETLTALSHEFGTPPFVKGGGGNTSTKLGNTLWIKPSGATMAGLTPEGFVAVDRERLGRLYTESPPQAVQAREAWVKDLMGEAVQAGSSGRPSVETPLHDSFTATYVVHTHAVFVNGMACARDGHEICSSLFPDALWMDYIDPGYTLCMEVRRALEAHREQHGREPAVVILKNHGVIVAGDSPEDIRQHYTRLVQKLGEQYAAAGISTELAEGPRPDGFADHVHEVEQVLQNLPGAPGGLHAAASGPFATVEGALTPDHIVYAGSTTYTGPVTADALEAFREQHGAYPKVIRSPLAVFGVGSSPASAELALALAADGALVQQLAQAFGGAVFMSPAAVDFIDNWEVEAFRKSVMNV